MSGIDLVRNGGRMTVAELLFAEGYAFDFFQAVRLLEKLEPERRPVGQAGPPRDEVVRFRAHLSLVFPPSAIFDLAPATSKVPAPAMTVTFMGLTGPSGVLPRHYTELLMRLDRDTRGPERYAFRAWLDLFNHRLISLFYRAWEKYRFHLPYEHGEYAGDNPDPFTQALFSFVGLGTPMLRERMRVQVPVHRALVPPQGWEGQKRLPGRDLGRIDDLAVLYYGGLLAQRRRPAVVLEAILTDYFGLPVQVQQFRGRWLLLEPANQTEVGGANCELGANIVAGERVWDVQSKLRLRLGPLRRVQFDALLPDRSPVPLRKAFFLLSQLVRFYLGPEFDFDVQLVLCRDDIPECQFGGEGLGARLGWNTWMVSEPCPTDADDAVFEGDEVRWIQPADAR